ncbi:PREDICTED: transcription factor ABORTED MICROSPORES-like isoform X2 [Tarenaya hassleriana]|uniref:transcription factor ABORTED MICROSPORES-like isoform X2 n=1 Tax=Tarenaya hassleriana TaxID=28532 RepID=UPI00053C62D8|nr:PREDICTED: transcription factor ABORTED MICROSPORES-like isoform X2 [Tarenaya hassleriana]
MESTIQNLLEKLRSLVGTRGWDYCVLWKLSDDQRFVKWLGCCCGGAEEIISNFDGNDNGGEGFCFSSGVPSRCRDVMFHHPRTKSCELLANLPVSIPLESGIHTETLVSNQTAWLNFSDRSEPEFLQETTCTRVLIPMPGGLVELFVTRQVSEDQHIVDFVMRECNFLLDHTSIGALSMNMMGAEKLGEYEVEHIKLKNDYQELGFLPENKHMGMNPFNLVVAEDEIIGMEALHNSMGVGAVDMHNVEGCDPSLQVKEQDDKETFSHENGRLELGSDCSDQMDDEDDAKFKQEKIGKGSQAKNLMAERRRRKKLNDRLYTLRSLVPKISKLDRASILEDAINFVKELQNEAKELQEELEDNLDTNDGSNRHNGDVAIGGNNDLVKGFHSGLSCNTTNVPNLKQDMDPNQSSNEKEQKMEPQVDVAQVDRKEFFVKVICEYKSGIFTKLIEAMDSLGFEVTNANTTRLLGLVSNVFKVKRKDSEMVQAEHVRDSLLEITRNTSRGWHGGGDDDDHIGFHWAEDGFEETANTQDLKVTIDEISELMNNVRLRQNDKKNQRPRLLEKRKLGESTVQDLEIHGGKHDDTLVGNFARKDSEKPNRISENSDIFTEAMANYLKHVINVSNI